MQHFVPVRSRFTALFLQKARLSLLEGRQRWSVLRETPPQRICVSPRGSMELDAVAILQAIKCIQQTDHANQILHDSTTGRVWHTPALLQAVEELVTTQHEVHTVDQISASLTLDPALAARALAMLRDGGELLTHLSSTSVCGPGLWAALDQHLTSTAASQGTAPLGVAAQSLSLPLSAVADRVRGDSWSGRPELLWTVSGQLSLLHPQHVIDHMLQLLAALDACTKQVGVSSVPCSLPADLVATLLPALVHPASVCTLPQPFLTAVRQGIVVEGVLSPGHQWAGNCISFSSSAAVQEEQQAASQRLRADGYISAAAARSMGIHDALSCDPPAMGLPAVLCLPSGFLLMERVEQAAGQLLAEVPPGCQEATWCDVGDSFPSTLPQEEMPAVLAALQGAGAPWAGLDPSSARTAWEAEPALPALHLAGTVFVSPPWLRALLSAVHAAAMVAAAQTRAVSTARRLQPLVQTSVMEAGEAVEEAEAALAAKYAPAQGALSPVSSVDSFVMVEIDGSEAPQPHTPPPDTAEETAAVSRAKQYLSDATTASDLVSAVLEQAEGAECLVVPGCTPLPLPAADTAGHWAAACLAIDTVRLHLTRDSPIARVAAVKAKVAQVAITALCDADTAAVGLEALSCHLQAPEVLLAASAWAGCTDVEQGLLSNIASLEAELVGAARATVYAPATMARGALPLTPTLSSVDFGGDVEELERQLVAVGCALVDALPPAARGLSAVLLSGDFPHIPRGHWGESHDGVQSTLQRVAAEGGVPPGPSLQEAGDAGVLAAASSAQSTWAVGATQAIGDVLLSLVALRLQQGDSLLATLAAHPCLAQTPLEPHMGSHLLHAYLPTVATTPQEQLPQPLLSPQHRARALGVLLEALGGAGSPPDEEDGVVAGAGVVGGEEEELFTPLAARAPVPGTWGLLNLLALHKAMVAPAAPPLVRTDTLCCAVETAWAAAQRPQPKNAGGASSAAKSKGSKAKSAAASASPALALLAAAAKSAASVALPRRQRSRLVQLLGNGSGLSGAEAHEVVLLAASVAKQWCGGLPDGMPVLLRSLPSKDKAFKKALKAQHAAALAPLLLRNKGVPPSLAVQVAAVVSCRGERASFGVLPVPLTWAAEGSAGDLARLFLLCSARTTEEVWDQL